MRTTSKLCENAENKNMLGQMDAPWPTLSELGGQNLPL